MEKREKNWQKFERKITNLPTDINVRDRKKMTSNANSEKSVEMNAPREESIETTPEDTMDTLLGRPVTPERNISTSGRNRTLTVTVQMSESLLQLSNLWWILITTKTLNNKRKRTGI